MTTKAKYEQIAERVGQYPYGVGRSQIADDFGITISTAREHLDRCVERGLLKRFYGWLTSSSRGWLYIDPEDAPEFDWVDAVGPEVRIVPPLMTDPDNDPDRPCLFDDLPF